MEIGNILDAALSLVVVVSYFSIKNNWEQSVALRKRGLVDTHPNCDEFLMWLYLHL